MKRKLIIPFDDRVDVLTTRDYYTFTLDLPPAVVYRNITIVGQFFFPVTGLTDDPQPMFELSITYAGNQVAHEYVNTSLFYNGLRIAPYEVGDNTNLTISNTLDEQTKLLPSCELQRYFGLISEPRAKSYITPVNPFYGNYTYNVDIDTTAANLAAANKYPIYSDMNSPTYTFDPMFGYTSVSCGGLDARRGSVQISIQVTKPTDSQTIPGSTTLNTLLANAGNIYAVCDIEDKPEKVGVRKEFMTYITLSKPGMDFMDKRKTFNLEVVNMDMLYGIAGYNGYDDIVANESGVDTVNSNYTLPQNGYGLYLYNSQVGMIPSYTNISKVTTNSLVTESILQKGLPAREGLNMIAHRNSYFNNAANSSDSSSGVNLVGMGKMSYD